MFIVSIAEAMSHDWQHTDGVETLTYIAPDGAVTADVRGRRLELSWRETMAGGPLGLEPTDIVWEVWRDTLGAADLAQGGRLTDGAGVAWRVLSFTRAVGLGAVVVTYRAVCRKQV